MLERILGAVWRGFNALLACDHAVAAALLLIAAGGIGAAYGSYAATVQECEDGDC